MLAVMMTAFLAMTLPAPTQAFLQQCPFSSSPGLSPRAPLRQRSELKSTFVVPRLSPRLAIVPFNAETIIRIVAPFGEFIGSTLPGHIILGASVGALGDFLSQSARGGKFDWWRFRGFVAFGAAVDGYIQHYFYGHWLPCLESVWIQMLVDHCLWCPLGFYPLYYIVSGLTQHQRSPRASLQCYWKDLFKVLPVYYKFWVPMQLINFCVVPVQFRCTFVLVGSISWIVRMSTLQAKIEAKNMRQNNINGV